MYSTQPRRVLLRSSLNQRAKKIEICFVVCLVHDRPILTRFYASAMLAVGGQDGHIRLFDPRLRSSTPEHTLKAHTGPIQAMAITPTDGLKVQLRCPQCVDAKLRLSFSSSAGQRSSAYAPPSSIGRRRPHMVNMHSTGPRFQSSWLCHADGMNRD